MKLLHSQALDSYCQEFPGGLVVRILGFHYRGLGSIPGRGTEIPQAARRSPPQKKKKKKMATANVENFNQKSQLCIDASATTKSHKLFK